MTTTDTLGRKDHLTFRGNVKAGRHGWLRLTPAYSLHVVDDILDENATTKCVLDPFSGTGTTPLAACVRGIPCHSVDINPFLVWFGNVKLAKYDADDARELSDQGSEVVERLRSEDGEAMQWVPALANIEKWWDEPDLIALSRLFSRLSCLADVVDPRIVDLLKIAFLRVMIATAHVSFGHQSMSFKKRSSNTPLFDHIAADEQVFDAFLGHVEWVAAGLEREQPSAEAEVLLGDSRQLPHALPRRDYTLVLTSPPYPNRMSYVRELRPYMYWLGFLKTGRQAGELDWQAIGGTWGMATSALGSWQPDPERSVPFSKFEKIVRDISKQHEILGRYVHKYFQDICGHINSLKQVLASGARCYYIVGNSKFYDTIVPVEAIYSAIFDDPGFANTRIDVLRKRTSKKELYEYCVYAENV